MRRYTSLLLTAFALFLVVLCGSAYLAGADDAQKQRPMREILAYTTLPPAQVEMLSDEYEKSSRVRVNFVPLSQQDLLERLKERRLESWKDELNKEEELVVDDVVTAKYGAANA